MGEEMSEARALIEQAQKDARALKDLNNIDREYYASHICFFAQQAAEKSIKSALTYRGLTYPARHNIDLLLGVCKREGLFEPSDDVFRAGGRLTRYEAEARYDTAHDLTVGDIALAVDYANQIADVLIAAGYEGVRIELGTNAAEGPKVIEESE